MSSDTLPWESQRRDPDHSGPIKELLEQFLDYHRATIVQKCDGLTEEELRRRLVPSQTSLLGILKHLAYVELGWFQNTFANLNVADPGKDDPDWDWRLQEGESFETILAFYNDQCAKSRAITRAADLDDIALHPKVDKSLGWILVHMVEETSRHNGHADILREQIDGSTGE
jgi:uncharacterized damage-inducible protein DinB